MSETNNNTQLKQKLKMYAVFALMGIICAAIIWKLFSPSDADKQKEQIGMGFNADIPDPKKDEIIGDKKDAYEQSEMKQRQKDQMQSLQGYADMLENSKNEHITLDLGDESKQKQVQSTAKAPINNSVSAYKDINRTLGNFYEKPKDDPEKEEMKKKLEELEAKMNDRNDKQSAMDEQLVLMEKSYELAAKYMSQGQNMEEQPTEDESLSKRITKRSVSMSNGKTKISPVHQIQRQLVSSLAQDVSSEELFLMDDQPRNMGFNTMGGEIGISRKNTISAVIHGDQTVIDGQAIRLRLTEPLVAGTTLIPENTILTGVAKIQGERLDIQISSIEYQGTIVAVEMIVYDTDAQKGIHIPGSLEMNAVKEVVANMGNSVGTSFTMTQSTGAQLASDLSKGAIQGVSAYMQKKIRQVKVTLKSGYCIMLMLKENN